MFKVHAKLKILLVCNFIEQVNGKSPAQPPKQCHQLNFRTVSPTEFASSGEQFSELNYSIEQVNGKSPAQYSEISPVEFAAIGEYLFAATFQQLFIEQVTESHQLKIRSSILKNLKSI